ncbi:MAG TPA: hypothetical protein VHI99_17645 [Vicinamibacterales bacterium]|jgi:hypothetical protein|nr:hypothetical protein [Vicinamibacterales bacterium]
MHLTEPVTTLTDYGLAAVSLAFAIWMGRSINSANRVTAWFWCVAFMASGVAALSGGTWHGLAAHPDAGMRQVLWNLVMFSMGASGAFMVAGIHAANVRRKDGTVKWLVLGIVATLLAVGIRHAGLPMSADVKHNDAYHLIQLVGLYFFYRCARTVRDRPGVPSSQWQ